MSTYKIFLIILVYNLLFIPFFSDATEMLPEIVITAARRTQTVTESLASVSVITRDQIEQSHYVTVPEILRQVPGLEVVSNGGLGKVSSLFVRGTEADHVLILVDGVKIGSATLGSALLQDFPLDQIERIEVVRGPRSSLYGSEAVGGVIQIFTRTGMDAPRWYAKTSVGSHATYQATVGTADAQENMQYNVAIERLQSDGFNSCNGSPTESAGCFTLEPDADGYRNTSINAGVGYDFGELLRLNAQWLRIQGHNEYDAAFGGNETDFTQQVAGFKAETILNDQWNFTLQLGHNRDRQDNFGNQAIANHFNTDRWTASWLHNLSFNETHLLTVGYDYQKDQVESTTAYTVDSRDNNGLFAHYQTTMGLVEWTAGARIDDNEQFGQHATGSIALSYALTPNMQLLGSYGTAFKAPTFNDLYFPDFGNPTVQPEESQSFEIGLNWTASDYQGSIYAYRTLIDDMIGFDELYQTVNLDKARILGLEGTLEASLGHGWDGSVNFSWIKPEDEKTGNLLARRAEKTFNLTLGYTIEQTRLSAHWLAQSHRFDDKMNTRLIGGYGVLNVSGEYHFDQQWTMGMRIDNVFDKVYETASFYTMDERTFFISLRYQH